ncbi:MAG TPA: PAS domain-containing sensor histidine kinase, partial [Aggregicoccus sp.]|nr:PAS domain-containing sensor histidine kinase [Aggregicoccus sp.]
GGVVQLARRLQLRREGEAQPAPPEQTPLGRALSGAWGVEVVVARTAAGERTLRTAAAPVLQAGRVEAVVAMFGDVTEQRRREQAVALSEAKLSGIISIAADAILSIDAAQRITLFNRGAEAIFGYRAEEVLGQRLELLLPERFRASHPAQVQAFARGPDAARHMGERREVYGRRKDGEEFPAEAAISRLEVNGEPVMAVVLRDVSERARRQREQRFLVQASATLAESLDPQVTLDQLVRLCVPELADSCAVFLAEGDHARLAAVAHEDADGERLLREALGRAPLPLRAARGIAFVIASGEPQLLPTLPAELVDTLVRQDEGYRVLEALGVRGAVVVPLRARGRSLGALALLHTGHSSRTFGERELALAQELAHRSALAIDSAQLYARAQEATRMRDEVLGVVAHDLRNPLHTVTLTARQLLGRRQADPVAERGMERVLRSAQRMDRLIQDLLDVVRVEAGTLALHPEPHSAAQLVQAVVEPLRPLAAEAQLTVEVRVEGDPGRVSADADRMHQVLGNLVGNALKFTPAGGRITVGVAPRDGQVLFWVADTGPGIPGEQLPHLFERYWQGRSADRRGAGLGLSIVKGLVEAHGGRIWAESRAGEGSTFFFTLPRPPAATQSLPHA